MKTPSGWRVVQDPMPELEASASAPAVLPTEQPEKATPILGAPFEPSAAEATAEEKAAAAAEAEAGAEVAGAVEAAVEAAAEEATVEEAILEEVETGLAAAKETAVVKEETPEAAEASQKVQAAAFSTMVSHQVPCFG